MMLDRHDDVVRRFAVAGATGDIAALAAVLNADVVAVCDGGGHLPAAVRPLHGAGEIARLVVALLSGQSETDVAVEAVNGRSGLALRRGGQAVAVIAVSVAAEQVAALWIVLNPDKLRGWHSR
jgi:RNA polymerase sigma-70 factor (ECF subfamily)